MKRIDISIAEQVLRLYEGDNLLFSAAVSTALNGPGEKEGSECTPCGRHEIHSMIGEGCAEGSVFMGREPTGEIYSLQLAEQYPQRDWILSRIIWLSGCEQGVNKGGDVDSHQRFIYIHGTPDSEPMGVPLSHGCIRMRNHDVVDLYDQLEPGVAVMIRAD
jgi:lipoprotein-anchoring transpeptidase ErfK/SrfK